MKILVFRVTTTVLICLGLPMMLIAFYKVGGMDSLLMLSMVLGKAVLAVALVLGLAFALSEREEIAQTLGLCTTHRLLVNHKSVSVPVSIALYLIISGIIMVLLLS